MKPRGGDGKATAVFLWLSLFSALRSAAPDLFRSTRAAPPLFIRFHHRRELKFIGGGICPNKSKGMTGLTTVAKVIELVGESQIGWRCRP